ncbi:hypothetical protein C8F04DRAFT_659958 [Mycena alexandri]|uniref:F-box domain-containing protein n=1 Tax=Mycena alexandri TaxID=1745969 RepID=A0AAD6S6D7_9AGAR|nr:hypothetical protein C8F04DRAFT_261051 [Mycena alexandri]KAJ7032451.1 hypothetical protein C8F04DRAFT_659958 [Mycena alexandri]
MLDAHAADRALVVDLDGRIQALQRSIEELTVQKKSAQARLDAYCYPVLTLPNEITSEIFLQFNPLYPLCPPLTGPFSPTLLTQICQKWRNIALSMSSLWRAISCDIRDVEEQCRMVDNWLGRSGNCPLSIRLSTSYRHGTGTARKIMGAVLVHLGRWEHISIVSLPHDGLLLPVDTPLPLLRTLELSVDWPYHPPLRGAISHDAPRLTSVVLGLFSYRNGGDLLPWSQLTSLTLLNQTPSQCTAILMHAVNLVYCELTLSEDGTQPQVISLPRLESLVIIHYEYDRESHSTAQNKYLLSFVAPALRRLQLPGECVAHVESFFEASGCQLQELHVTGESGVSFVEEELFRQALPSIPTISFNSRLIDWESPAAAQMRKRNEGRLSIADFAAA